MGQMVLPKLFLMIWKRNTFSPGKVRPEGKLVKFCQFQQKKELCLELHHFDLKKWPVLVKITFAGPFDNQGRWKTSIFIFFNLWFSNFYLQKSFSIFSSRNFVQNFPSSNIFKLRISFLMIAISNWIYLRRDLFFLKIFLSSRRKLSSDIGHSNTRGAREPRMEVWSSWKKSNYTWT